MPGRNIQPYRGQPIEHYPKPRRQIRNLRGEKKHYLFTAVILFTFSFLVLGVGIADYLYEHSEKALLVFILFFFILITLSMSALDTMQSINKFRPNYDIDTSEQPEIVEHPHHHDHDFHSIPPQSG